MLSKPKTNPAKQSKLTYWSAFVLFNLVVWIVCLCLGKVGGKMGTLIISFEK